MATVRAGLNNRKYTASPDLGDALIDTRDPSRGESGFERRQRLTPSPSGTDHVKVTMQTKIAVRDKTPHRFQVVPLRDARKHSPTAVPKDATPVASARSRLKSTGYQLSGSRAANENVYPSKSVETFKTLERNWNTPHNATDSPNKNRNILSEIPTSRSKTHQFSPSYSTPSILQPPFEPNQRQSSPRKDLATISNPIAPQSKYSSPSTKNNASLPTSLSGRYCVPPIPTVSPSPISNTRESTRKKHQTLHLSGHTRSNSIDRSDPLTAQDNSAIQRHKRGKSMGAEKTGSKTKRHAIYTTVNLVPDGGEDTSRPGRESRWKDSEGMAELRRLVELPRLVRGSNDGASFKVSSGISDPIMMDKNKAIIRPDNANTIAPPTPYYPSYSSGSLFDLYGVGNTRSKDASIPSHNSSRPKAENRAAIPGLPTRRADSQDHQTSVQSRRSSPSGAAGSNTAPNVSQLVARRTTMAAPPSFTSVFDLYGAPDDVSPSSRRTSALSRLSMLSTTRRSSSLDLAETEANHNVTRNEEASCYTGNYSGYLGSRPSGLASARNSERSIASMATVNTTLHSRGCSGDLTEDPRYQEPEPCVMTSLSSNLSTKSMASFKTARHSLASSVESDEEAERAEEDARHAALMGKLETRESFRSITSLVSARTSRGMDSVEFDFKEEPGHTGCKDPHTSLFSKLAARSITPLDTMRHSRVSSVDPELTDPAQPRHVDANAHHTGLSSQLSTSQLASFLPSLNTTTSPHHVIDSIDSLYGPPQVSSAFAPTPPITSNNLSLLNKRTTRPSLKVHVHAPPASTYDRGYSNDSIPSIYSQDSFVPREGLGRAWSIYTPPPPVKDAVDGLLCPPVPKEVDSSPPLSKARAMVDWDSEVAGNGRGSSVGTGCSIDEGGGPKWVAYHPIVLQLMVDVDLAIEEWANMIF